MTTKSTRVLVMVLAFVAIAAVVGWWAVARIESPAEVAAKTAPPAPSPILVPVEQRVLSSRIVTRGTGRFGLPQTISIAPSSLKREAGLITTIPLPNTQLVEGNVLLTASGRPVFVLQGNAPAYRDLVPGIAGNDVRQLQQALARLGFNPGPADGSYDARTADAVAALYRAGGWPPFGPTKGQIATINALRRELALAQKEKSAATGAVAAAALSVESARAKAEHDNSLAAAELANRRAERDLIVLDPRQTKTARQAAEAGLKQAESGVKAAALAGDLAIQAALELTKVADLDASLTSDRVDRLTSETSLAESRQGVQIPVDEIVFIPVLPVRVQELVVTVGDVARGPILTVTDNQLVIDSSLPLDVANLVHPGMPVRIDEQSIGIKATGTVSKRAVTSGTHGVDGYHIYFEVRVDETSAPLEGFSVRLTIPLKSTKGAVMAVPVSALTLVADGTSRVQAQSSSGALEYVVVEPGMSADGYVEITVVEGALTPGQLVVIGYEGR